MLRNDITEEALESCVEPLNVLKIAEAHCSRQPSHGQEEIVLPPVLKIHREILHQIFYEWIVVLSQRCYEI